MRRAADRTRTGSFTLAPGVHRPRCPEPCLDRTRLSAHPKQARYSTDYAQICGTNIMRGTTAQNRAVPGLGVEPRRARGPRDFKATGRGQRTKGLFNSLPFPVSEESEECRRV